MDDDVILNDRVWVALNDKEIRYVDMNATTMVAETFPLEIPEDCLNDTLIKIRVTAGRGGIYVGVASEVAEGERPVPENVNITS